MHDEKRKKVATLIFTPFAVLLFSAFGMADLVLSGPVCNTLVKLAIVPLIIINYILYKTKRISIARHTDAILAIMALFILYLVMYGRPERGGAMWLFVFPLLAFFVKGPLSGMIWTAANGLSVLAVCIISRFGLLNFAYYDCPVLAAMILPYIAICMIAFIYEFYSSDYRKRLTISERFIEENKRYSYQVELARQVQMQIIPSEDICNDTYEAAFFYEPAYRIGGDYIDYFDINEDISAFVLCDVVGKGIPAALLMMSLRTLILSLIKAGKTDPHDIIQSANTMFHDDYKDDFYVTLSFILFEKKNKIVHFYNAGHSPFIYFSKIENRIKEIELEGAPIGLFKKSPKEVSVDLQMYPEDIIVLFSDGLTDRINLRDLRNARARLFTLVQEHSHKSATELKEIITNCCHSYDDYCEYKDDISFIIIKIK